MYLPSHFAEDDPQALHALMRDHPLALLVHTGPDGLDGDHLPLEFDPAAGVLRGHVARANPLWRHADGAAVLAVFRGPQAYVSPSWYPSKAEHQRAVPTWNYAVVHVHGRLRAVDDAAWLREQVGRQTVHQEAPRRPRWGIDDAPAEYLQQMLRAIVGIEIEARRIVGKFKLSQNRSAQDHAGVLAGLDAEPAVGGATALAALMRTRPRVDRRD
jgi:transcriptional regulator